MIWIKKCGMEMNVNGDKVTTAYCESLGWEKKKAKAPEKKIEEKKPLFAGKIKKLSSED